MGGCSSSIPICNIPPLTFSAAWLASPEMVAVERVADLAGRIAQAAGRLTTPRPRVIEKRERENVREKLTGIAA